MKTTPEHPVLRPRDGPDDASSAGRVDSSKWNRSISNRMPSCRPTAANPAWLNARLAWYHGPRRAPLDQARNAPPLHLGTAGATIAARALDRPDQPLVPAAPGSPATPSPPTPRAPPRPTAAAPGHLRPLPPRDPRTRSPRAISRYFGSDAGRHLDPPRSHSDSPGTLTSPAFDIGRPLHGNRICRGPANCIAQIFPGERLITRLGRENRPRPISSAIFTEYSLAQVEKSATITWLAETNCI